MGLLGYIRDRARQRKLLMTRHDITKTEGLRDDNERREDDAWLEERLREEVRRYEDDLRELAQT
jgi:hypothetical protein